MQFPIHVGLHRSRLLARVSILLGGVALCFLYLFSRSTVAFAIFATLTLFLLAGMLRQSCLPLRALSLKCDGMIEVTLAGETDYFPASLLGGALIHPWLTIFRVEIQSKPDRVYSVVLLPDSLSAENFRRLRVFLRWHALKLSEAGDV